MEILHTIKIDLARMEIPPHLSFMQGDSARKIVAKLYENNVPWNIPSGASIYIAFTNASGENLKVITLSDGTPVATYSENSLTVSIPHELTAYEANIPLVVVLVDGSGKQITTFPIAVSVISSPSENSTDAEPVTPDMFSQLMSALAIERARINNLATLKEGSTTGDAELADIHVGFDGTTYPNAGEAVRGQVGELNSHIEGVLYSRNLLPVDYYDGDYKDYYGMTFQKLSDGTVVATGTPNGANGVYNIAYGTPIKAGTYTISGIPDGDTTKRFLRYSIGDDDSYVNFATGSKTFTIEADSILYVQIHYAIGCSSADNQQWRVMLEKGDTAHDFVSPVTAFEQMQNTLHTTATELDVVRDAASLVTKYTVNANTIMENPYTRIFDDGHIEAVAGNIAASDLRMCNVGDTLRYKLSIDTGYVLIAIYDKDLNCVATPVFGNGRSTYIEDEYTFTEGQAYFRIAGAPGYLKNYYAEYVPVQEIGITMEDVEEAIRNALEVDTLPDYYTDYMTERITAINDKDCLIGSHGDSFVFITDTHAPRNRMQSPKLIREIVNNTSVRFVINGGDTLDDNDTREEALSILREWRNLMRGIPEYRIIGNHDLNSLSSVAEAKLNEDDWYGTMVKPIEDMVKTDGKYYFCIDNESQKIRYICLSYLNGRTAERTWFKERLTELESGWTVLVIPHYLFGEQPGVIHPNGQYVINDINEVYGNMNATLIGVLAGHTHADYSTTEATNGYHLIATTCDAFTGTPTKTAGTVTEQAFDVIHIDTANRKMYATRIGAGEDREWSY